MERKVCLFPIGNVFCKTFLRSIVRIGFVYCCLNRATKAITFADLIRPRIFANTSDLHSNVGQLLGPTDWIQLSQERIDLFAKATNDHQVGMGFFTLGRFDVNE
jgi:hypothetical protein